MMKSQLQLKNLMLLGLFALAGLVLVSCNEDEGSNPLIPVVLSFSPASGEPGDEVTITGTDLENATEVTFNGTAATINSNTATEIRAVVPEGATTGKIAVKTAGGLGISTTDFEVIVVGAPTVTSVSPISALPGDNVVITGTDMADVSEVLIGDVAATIVSTTETTVEVTVGDSPVGPSSISLTNSGGTTVTSAETTEFYVIKVEPALGMTFDGEQTGIYTGSPDPEETNVYGPSSDATVAETAQALPTAIDGNFFHFEGYSTTGISGNYAAIVQNSSAMEPGTYAEFFSGISDEHIYFNLQVNVGELPADYDDALMGLRFRFDGDDYEFVPTPSELESMGFTANEEGWYSLSIPATAFDDDAAPGTFSFTDLQRVGVAARRNYGTGGTAGTQVTEADGGVFYSLSFDNLVISAGGPYSFPE